MKIRSTGLGKTELVCDIEKITTKDGYLILSIRSTEPVRWHVRCALTPKDMLKALWLSIFPGFRCFTSGVIPRKGPVGKLEY